MIVNLALTAAIHAFIAMACAYAKPRLGWRWGLIVATPLSAMMLLSFAFTGFPGGVKLVDLVFIPAIIAAGVAGAVLVASFRDAA